MLNSGTAILEWILEMGRRTEDQGGLGFKGYNLGNHVLAKYTTKGKNYLHREKTSTSARRCFYYRNEGHIRKECSNFLVRQKMSQQ